MCTCSRTFMKFPSITLSSILIVFSGLEYNLDAGRPLETSSKNTGKLDQASLHS